MSMILKKRKSLEQFIREQTIGPGINGYRFVDLNNTSISQNNLKTDSPIKNTTEIVNTMPAALYSTGILFPKDDSQTAEIGAENDASGADEEYNNEKTEELKSASENADSSETLELNQMFPQTMGLTFCVNEFSDNGELNFNIKTRYYRKLKNEDLSNIAVLCEVDYESFNEYLTKYELSKFFSIVDFGINKCLKTNHKLSSNDIEKVYEILKTIDNINTNSIYENHVKSNLNFEPHFPPKYLNTLLTDIFYELHYKTTDLNKRDSLYDASQKIELLENYKAHIINLVSLYSRDTFWRAENLTANVKISGLEFDKNKRTLLAGNPLLNGEKIEVNRNDNTETSSLKNIFKIPIENSEDEYASLSANIQLSRDSRNPQKKVFVKVQLINDSTSFKKDPEGKRYYSVATENVNNKAFFGVKISIQDKNIVPYSNHTFQKNDKGIYDEDTTTRFIYQQFEDYAIGHGCSVNWHVRNNIKKVETEYIPSYEVPDVEPVPRNKRSTPISIDNIHFTPPLFLENTKPQEFKWLSSFSDADNNDILKGLIEFVDSYDNWINLKRKDYQTEFKELAKQELDKCEKDYKRMRSNIENLLSGEKNIENLKSFRMMNSAMFMQLYHSKRAKDKSIIEMMKQDKFNGFDYDFYKNDASDKLFSTTDSAAWRAFQLAFILLNLDGVFKPDNDIKWTARNEWVDLVWFPTGGGKTEAYLGLIALTIINRRKLFGERGGGVTAIMRYTLRLLTMQQFQRATLVIMALELIRRWDISVLGEEPITIGLWVGDNSLPNKMTGLIEEFNRLIKDEPNKIPFQECPWCNSKLRPIPTGTPNNNNKDTFNFWKAHLYCDNNSCEFTQPCPFTSDSTKESAIPVNLCDESIYQHPPTLLFGTVDKFAQLAHKVNGNSDKRNTDSRRLFGNGNWETGKPKDGYLPPDLIIQDELHLLLGPLGSAVALFESAIDQLCTRENGTRPKIISSTATTRNTQLQIAALFGRKVNLFPKPGVECDDSFFAFYKRTFDSTENTTPQYIANRKYLGILPTGRTQIWMQMRLAAILMTHRAVFELKELGENEPIDFDKYDKKFIKAMNYYHTIISYFNSLKEVGKTESQIQTYILKEIRKIFNRVVRPQKLMHAFYTYGPIEKAELTGRLSGEEVKTELKNVETEWKPENRLAHIVDDTTQRGMIPPEFVVATNMISVGIDVSRFNTMIINSMPRNTAEYIQASSRVARDNYGLVLTVHHPFRARDISHYEKFVEFHEKMYSYVEPISITPFTKKAIERYLGLYLATMIRHTLSEFTNRDSADVISKLTQDDIEKITDNLIQYFIRTQENFNKFDNIIQNLLQDENIELIKSWIGVAIVEWKELHDKLDENSKLVFNNAVNNANQVINQQQLYVDIEAYENNIHSKRWQIPMSLRVIEQEAAIKINSI